MDVRLLTLTGPGGLALCLASDRVETMPDGVWLVELAKLEDARLLSQAVAGTLDLRQQPCAPLHVELQQALRDRELLLVLDTCERLAAACAVVVSDLLRGGKRLRQPTGSTTHTKVARTIGAVAWAAAEVIPGSD